MVLGVLVFDFNCTLCVYGDGVRCIRFHFKILDHMEVELIELKGKEIGKRKWKGGEGGV